jgi:hypothetical protein
MRKDDDELEKYLSEFRPRAVRPLELPRPAAKTWMKRLAVAAMVLLCAGSGLWYVRRGRTIPPPAPQMPATQVEIPAATGRPNPFSLTKLALEDDRRFEAQLEANSRLVLPGFEGEQSMLRVLAKE